MKRVLTMAVAAVMIAPLAVAETWRCEMNRVDAHGWISHQLEVQLASDGSARVYDSAIREVFGAPIDAEVSENAGKRLKVKWVPRNLQVNTGRIISRPRYSAFINRDTRRVTASVSLGVSDMLIVGQGNCRETAGTGRFAPTSRPRQRIIIEIPFD
jgi:hypothetical protein